VIDAFTNTPILADAGQLIGVLLMLAGAVGYLTIYYRRKLKGDAGDCCGGGGCGIPLKRKPESNPQQAQDKPSTGSQQFLPAENLADLAARHRKQLDEKNAPDKRVSG
jgi:hypothetical protein